MLSRSFRNLLTGTMIGVIGSTMGLGGAATALAAPPSPAPAKVAQHKTTKAKHTKKAKKHAKKHTKKNSKKHAKKHNKTTKATHKTAKAKNHKH
jgi:gas vesicle protein